MKTLRPSVIASREWDKEKPRNWQAVRKYALERDGYTCAYCSLVCKKFMQINHIGAEDNHSLDNLETVCRACHGVLHMGASAANGALTVFECRPEAENVAVIVAHTRSLVAKSVPWIEIEQCILSQFIRPGGKVCTYEESVAWANKMLQSIRPPYLRGYLPDGYAVLFHEEGEWSGYPEKVWKWQCLPGSKYRKEKKGAEV